MKRLAAGELSNLTHSTIESYSMEYNETHGVYRHACRRVDVPDGDQPIFTSTCYKCLKSIYTTLEHERPETQKRYGIASPV